MKRQKTKIRWLAALVVMAMFVTILPCKVYAEDTNPGESTNYKHTYHTKVEVTANITVLDANGNTTETKQVTKESEFIKGNVADTDVESEITRIKNTIRGEYNPNWNYTETETSTKLKFDHFESSNILEGEGESSGQQEGTNKILDVHEYQIYEINYDLIVQQNEANSVIGDVDIESVTLGYNIGDAPKATATKLDPYSDLYDIEYEYWEQMEQTANGVEPVAYWYSDASKYNALPDDKKITTFEEGKSYMYSISLKAKNGCSFDANSKVMVNGSNVNAGNVTNSGSVMFVTAIKTIKMIKPVPLKKIDLIELNGATISFKTGDKPIFTGKVPDGAPYIYQCEWWLCGDAGVNSAEFWDKSFTDHITKFEAGKKYEYGAYFKAAEGYCFTSGTKLKINGTEYTYHLRSGDPELEHPDEMSTLWMIIGLTMTPSEASAQYEIIEGANGSWTQDTDGTLTVRANGEFSKFTGVKVDGTLIDAKNYSAKSGSTIITLKPEYLQSLSAGSHNLTVVYVDGECSTKFEVKAVAKPADVKTPETSVNVPKQSKPADQTTPKSPKTGDESNPFVWLLLGFVSASAAGMMIYKKNR